MSSLTRILVRLMSGSASPRDEAENKTVVVVLAFEVVRKVYRRVVPWP